MPGTPRQSRAQSSPTTPPPTTTTRSPTTGRASHITFTAVSRLAASTARPGGTPAGRRVTALRGTV